MNSQAAQDGGRDDMTSLDALARDNSIPSLTEGESVTLLRRVVTLVVVLLPFVGMITAVVYLWGWGVDWINLILLLTMYVATGLGITIGFHRLVAHKSFRTNRIVQSIFVVLGSMAVEGSLFQWVATHRCHHHHSDESDDPHSPHTHGAGIINMFRGLWRAHMGWLFEPFPRDLSRYIADIRSDRFLSTLSTLFPLWVALGLLIPTGLAGLITQSWTGALLGLLWGGLARIFLVHHVTWSINSVCHIWGSRPFDSHDESRNNPIFGVLAFGEGWHNNHHAFPASARHGLRWWQTDISYMVIWTLSKIGLAHDVRVPPRHRIDAKQRG